MELTNEQIEAVKQANEILAEVGMVILSVGCPKPPQ